MKQVVCAGLFLALGAATALAQGDRKEELEKLQKSFEQSMKALEQKFEMERAKLGKEFKAAREKLLRKTPTPPRAKKAPPNPRGELRGFEELMKRVMEQGRRGFERGRNFPRGPKELPDKLEKVLEDVLKRLERLEKKLEPTPEGRRPQFRQFRWQGPKDFEFDFDFRDFKDFEKFMPKNEREWKEWFPKFRYKFRREFDDRERDEDEDNDF